MTLDQCFAAMRFAQFYTTPVIHESWPGDRFGNVGGPSLSPMAKREKHDEALVLEKGITTKYRPWY